METRCMGCMQIKQRGLRCEHCGFDERTANNTHQLPVGTVVGGQYTLGRVLGQGGFGITYIGWDNVMQQRVAVKEYFPSGYAGRSGNSQTVTSYDHQSRHDFENNKRRFLREAESLAKLWNVPQIVKVLRYFEENGTAYIAMEYVEGVDLRKYVKQHRGPLSVEETLSLLGPVIQALGQVHKAELVHRDISPDNIMVLPDGSTKLLDFGAARYVQNANALQDRDTSTQAILKHGFAPPEQYQTHGALGPWTDVYAMCATIYYCLTGNVLPEAMSRSVEQEPIDWSRIQGLTKRQRTALEKGLALLPKNRVASMEELWQQLKPPAPRPEKPTKQPKAAVEPKNPKSKKPLLLTAIAAAMVAVTVIGMQFLSKDSTRKNQQVRVPETAAATSEEASRPVETGTAASPVDLMPEEIPVDVEFTYEENETGITITGYEEKWIHIPEETSDGMPPKIDNGELNQDVLPKHLLIPAEIDGKPVTQIGAEAFSGCTKLETVSLPENITMIGAGAFSGCTGLRSFSIPEGVTEIAGKAFEGCSGLSEVIIREGVTKIGGYAFSDCSGLTEVIIPDTVTEIYTGTFAGCISIKKITIPGSISVIPMYAFNNCTGLSEVIIENGVQMIEWEAFSGCEALEKVTIANGVTEIHEAAFKNCVSLSSIVIPESVSYIGNDVFYNCTMLSSVSLSDKVTYIGSDAFYKTLWLNAQTEEFVIVGDGILLKYNGVESDVVIPDTVKMITSAFSGYEGLRSVAIPKSVTIIGEAAFARSGLTQVVVPDSVTEISTSAFAKCAGLTQVVLPNSLEIMGVNAFGYCTALTSITIPGGVKRIGQYAFQSCDELNRVVIKEGIEVIDGCAFNGCDKLSDVTIPRSVMEIGTWAFDGCNLSSVTISKDCKLAYPNVFDETCVVNYY